MNEQAQTKPGKEWSAGVVNQRALIMLLVALCLCVCAGCVATIAASGCPVDDFFFRVFLQLKPTVPLPDHTIAKLVDGAQGSHGGWTGGLYATDTAPEIVVNFYQRIGGSCQLSTNTKYQLGGFTLDVQAPYWDCNAPARPWSRGAVTVFPQAGYVNALRAIYYDPPQLSRGLTINETQVGYELRQFYGQPPFANRDWPEGGTILRASVGWCDP